MNMRKIVILSAAMLVSFSAVDSRAGSVTNPDAVTPKSSVLALEEFGASPQSPWSPPPTSYQGEASNHEIAWRPWRPVIIIRPRPRPRHTDDAMTGTAAGSMDVAWRPWRPVVIFRPRPRPRHTDDAMTGTAAGSMDVAWRPWRPVVIFRPRPRPRLTDDAAVA